MPYLFDLCGTLSPLNNTWDFIRFVYFKKNKRMLFFWRKLISKIISIIFKKNPYKSRRLRIKLFYGGFHREELEKMSEEYFNLVFYPSLFKNLKKFLKNKKKVLFTASPDYPAKKIGELLGFSKKDIYSSVLEFKKSKICTGNLIWDNYLENKARLFEKSNLNKNFIFFTNNLKEDFSLLKYSKKVYLVSRGEIKKIK
ncbi:hypothetical protein K0A97_01845 [Patescibacteria group bacterium]|nr:hypothetical protein [Patescibacteria group bacterium]